MINGVKSSEFGCFWKSLFLVSLCLPDKIDYNNKNHLQKIRYFKRYYNSLQNVLPCSFCRVFTKKVLMKKYPLNYSGRIALMKSLYIWKKVVGMKLGEKKSPPFSEIRKHYEQFYATCDPKVGKCI